MVLYCGHICCRLVNQAFFCSICCIQYSTIPFPDLFLSQLLQLKIKLSASKKIEDIRWIVMHILYCAINIQFFLKKRGCILTFSPWGTWAWNSCDIVILSTVGDNVWYWLSIDGTIVGIICSSILYSFFNSKRSGWSMLKKYCVELLDHKTGFPAIGK